jgi:hypothetical protein
VAKDEQVWRPTDLRQTIVEFQGYRVVIYPYIKLDGWVVWGATVLIVENQMVLVDIPHQDTYQLAYEMVIGSLETFIGGLLGMSKALLNHKEKALGKSERKT